MLSCSFFCPVLPLQDYLLQGWYSSFYLYFQLGLLTHHHCLFCYSPLLLPQTMVDSFHSPHQSLPYLLPVILHSQLTNFPQACHYDNLDYVYQVPYQKYRHKTNKLISRLKILLRFLNWISDAIYFFCNILIRRVIF